MFTAQPLPTGPPAGVGVGGAGGNAIANMIQAQIEGVDFVVANTDAQALNNSIAENRIQLGPDITQGLGAGSRPEVGRAAAEETLEQIDQPGVRAKELTLRSLAAVDEDAISTAPEERGRGSTGRRGRRCGGTEEDEIQVHGRRS